jgi:hypothetical protein
VVAGAVPGDGSGHDGSVCEGGWGVSVLAGKGRRRMVPPVSGSEDEGRLSFVEWKEVQTETQRMLARAVWQTMEYIYHGAGEWDAEKYSADMLTTAQEIHDDRLNPEIECNEAERGPCAFMAEIQRLYEVHSGA